MRNSTAGAYFVLLHKIGFDFTIRQSRHGFQNTKIEECVEERDIAHLLVAHGINLFITNKWNNTAADSLQNNEFFKQLVFEL